MMKVIGHGLQNRQFGNRTLIGTVPSLDQLIEEVLANSVA